jgi:DNA replication protein DnaC
MKNHTEPLEYASVRQYCKAVRVPAIGANFVSLAEQAVKENQTHIRYLEALLQVESEERDRHAIANRIRDAQLPRMKTLEEFDFAQAPRIPAAKIRELAEGGYIERSEPVVLIGECGTGKSHLATGLCLEACRQKRRVRFITAAALVNELVEAKHNNQVRRMMARWQRYELIAVDEVGYVPLADVGAEFLVPGDLGAGGKSGADRDDESAVFGMDHRVSQSAAVQSSARPHYGPGSYRRDRNGIVPFPPDDGKEEEKNVKFGWLAPRGVVKSRGVSFLRHEQIYQSDVVFKVRSEARSGFAPVPSFR